MTRGPERAAIKRAGFEDALRHVCEWGSGTGTGMTMTTTTTIQMHGVGSLGRGAVGAVGGGRGLEGDRDVIEQARLALHLLEYVD